MPTPREWEVAAEHYLRSQGCVETRRAVRTQWQRVDFFGADVVGKSTGATYYAQVTKGARSNATSPRRRKLEAVPWLPTDRVLILQGRTVPDPADGHRHLHFFRVHELQGGQWSVAREAVEVPREWFRARPSGAASRNGPAANRGPRSQASQGSGDPPSPASL